MQETYRKAESLLSDKQRFIDEINSVTAEKLLYTCAVEMVTLLNIEYYIGQSSELNTYLAFSLYYFFKDVFILREGALVGGAERVSS